MCDNVVLVIEIAEVASVVFQSVVRCEVGYTMGCRVVCAVYMVLDIRGSMRFGGGTVRD